MNRTFTHALILTLCFSMLACGFRLRGSIGLPEGLSSIYIKGLATYSPLNVELRKIFKRSNATIEDSEKNASVVLIIIKEDFQRRVLSVDSLARAAEYQLVYVVEFQLQNQSGETLVEQQKVSVIRDYRFDPDNVLAKEREEEQIRQGMVLFAVRQMLRRIDSRLKASVKKKSSGTDTSEDGNDNSIPVINNAPLDNLEQK